jgi:hypothetical protein
MDENFSFDYISKTSPNIPTAVVDLVTNFTTQLPAIQKWTATMNQRDIDATTVASLSVQTLSALTANLLTLTSTTLNLNVLTLLNLNVLVLAVNTINLNFMSLNVINLLGMTINCIIVNTAMINSIFVMSPFVNSIYLNCLFVNTLQVSSLTINSIYVNTIWVNCLMINTVTANQIVVGGVYVNNILVNSATTNGIAVNPVLFNFISFQTLDFESQYLQPEPTTNQFLKNAVFVRGNEVNTQTMSEHDWRNFWEYLPQSFPRPIKPILPGVRGSSSLVTQVRHLVCIPPKSSNNSSMILTTLRFQTIGLGNQYNLTNGRFFTSVGGVYRVAVRVCFSETVESGTLLVLCRQPKGKHMILLLDARQQTRVFEGSQIMHLDRADEIFLWFLVSQTNNMSCAPSLANSYASLELVLPDPL